jgi:orotate phosphoribosyltransferase
MHPHEVKVHAPDLATVLQQAYDLAILDRSHRPFQPAGAAADHRASHWALDMRLPLSRSELLHPIARTMARDLAAADVGQIAGYGYGSYALIGAVVALAPRLTGALIRDAAKPYGFGRRIEGDLDPQQRVIIVDDLLSTGRSAQRAAAALRAEGFLVTGVFTVFRFAGRSGRAALHDAGLGHRCLGTLHRRPALPVSPQHGEAAVTP